jgi:hypothetical protein
MSESGGKWGIVAAVLGGGGSLIGGIAAVMTLSKNEPAPQTAVQPVAAVSSAVTAESPPQQEEQPQVTQASINSSQHAELQQLVSNILDNLQQQQAPGMRVNAQEIVSLQPGMSYDWSVNLAGGVPYRIVGGCDNQCSDVDIQLVNAGGSVVTEDTLDDDYPVVNFTPPGAGTYKVRILMRTCTVAPCYAGARLYTPN